MRRHDTDRTTTGPDWGTYRRCCNRSFFTHSVFQPTGVLEQLDPISWSSQVYDRRLTAGVADQRRPAVQHLDILRDRGERPAMSADIFHGPLILRISS